MPIYPLVQVVVVRDGEGMKRRREMGWDGMVFSPNSKTKDTLATAGDVILLHCTYLLSLFPFSSFFSSAGVLLSLFHCYYPSLLRAAYRMLMRLMHQLYVIPDAYLSSDAGDGKTRTRWRSRGMLYHCIVLHSFPSFLSFHFFSYGTIPFFRYHMLGLSAYRISCFVI